MIKDVMVRLDGTAADTPRLAAAKSIAELFQGHLIGLFFNVLPLVIPSDGDPPSARLSVELIEKAREAGDKTEALLLQRLAHLNRPVEVRRFDVFADDIPDVATREMRAGDTFVAERLKPNGDPKHKNAEELVEGVLFGSGRHVFLVGDEKDAPRDGFNHALVAWNGSREAARALSEAMPYLHKAKAVTVVVVDHETPTERGALMGADAVTHLNHHGIEAVLHHAKSSKGDVSATLIREARRRNADLIVMGGYGHSRLREWLLGGVTYQLLRHAPAPMVIAH